MSPDYFFISYEKFTLDCLELIGIIPHDWVNSDMTIVNCDPLYSSILCQLANHKLSYLNNHELFFQLSLSMPLPGMSQVWSGDMDTPEVFESYLASWAVKFLRKGSKYLFLADSTDSGKNLSKVFSQAKNHLDTDDYIFGTVYKEKSSLFQPNFYVEEFSRSEKGELLYQWEDSFSKNWN